MKNQLIIVGMLLISGCTTTLKDNIAEYKKERDKVESVRGNRSYGEGLISDMKNCKGTCPFSDEASYLKTINKDGKLTGLALSGGGTRSASFSIGILKALHDTDKLKDIDIISGVSGGAYATYWFFSQNYYMDEVNNELDEKYQLEDIFRTKNVSKDSLALTNLDSANRYRFQKALEESSDILAYRHNDAWYNPIFTRLQLGTQLFIQGLSTPIHWVTNGLFDWEINGMPFFYYYKDGLDRTYGYVPLDYTMEHFANAQRDKYFFGVKNIDAFSRFMCDYQGVLTGKTSEQCKTYDNEYGREYDKACDKASDKGECKKHQERMPYFIINTTGVLDAKWNGSKYSKDGTDVSTENRVFEFTPWGCHSVLLGVNHHDKACEDFHWRSFQSRDLDLAKIVAISGAAVDGETQAIDADGNADKPNFWLNLFMDVMHLNMGYHLSSPNNNFSNSNNNFLAQANGIFHKLLPWPLYIGHDLLLDEQSLGIYLSDGGHSENLAVWPLIRRGVEEIYLVDAEQDQLSKFDSAKRLNKELQKYGFELCFGQNYPLDVYNADQPIFDAAIRTLGDCDKKVERLISTIHYIKLSVPSKEYGSKNERKIALPFNVTRYMIKNPTFPQQSTADIFYSPEQFMAYRDLGYKLMLCRLKRDTCLLTEYYSGQ